MFSLLVGIFDFFKLFANIVSQDVGIFSKSIENVNIKQAKNVSDT